MIRFEVLGEPVPQGGMTAFQVKGKARVAYKNSKGLSVYRNDVAEALAHTEWELEPRPTAILVDAVFVLKRPQAHFGTGKNAGVLKESAPEYPTGARPDVDKILRSLLDALDRAGAFEDDGQVASVRAEKRYTEQGESPKTIVTLARLDEWAAPLEGGARVYDLEPSEVT